ncbi:MAG: VWA domain-containing protein [Deltaproteobacteria bacterium]|nr:VWA domain-containing protein [Deltaproteobacteria bacterium]
MTLENCPRFLPLILLLLFATPGVANDTPAAQPGEPVQQEPLAIELDRPVSDQHIRAPAPLVEVSGRAGTLPFFASDVVLLIDHSTLALLASGIDVDRDGVVGRTRSSVKFWEPLAPKAPFWTTDSGDTVQELQLRIARALISRLAARQNRVGMASFTFRARTDGTSVVRLTEKPGISVPVGDPEVVLAALADFPPARERRWTDLTRLIERGAELLDAATPDTEPSRPRAILLLSHGEPSAPSGVGWSSQRAVEYAAELDDRGISLWAIPLRSADTPFLSELSRGSGGKVLPLDRLDAQFGAPVPSDLRPRELEIENVTNHERATGQRVFPDGRFDAMVPLEPGANTLEIRAVLADGQRTTVRRVVHYEAAPAEQNP